MAGMIHVTPSRLVPCILEEGIRCGMAQSLTIDIAWTMPWYETPPVFLGKPDSRFIESILETEDDYKILEVDIDGLDLVADLASLVDIGAYVDNGLLWWKHGREPEILLPYLDEDGGIEIEFLIDPSTDACKAAIEATGTAAYLGNIEPVRIRLPHVIPNLSR
jgi:hypothetical protein